MLILKYDRSQFYITKKNRTYYIKTWKNYKNVFRHRKLCVRSELKTFQLFYITKYRTKGDLPIYTIWNELFTNSDNLLKKYDKPCSRDGAVCTRREDATITRRQE